MSTTLPSAGTIELIANAASQDTAISDAFTVSADGIYSFAFQQSGAFTALKFNLLRFSAFSPIVQRVIDALLTPSLTLALVAGITYQLVCTAFADGSTVSVVATGPNAPAPAPPTQVEITDPIEVTTPLPVSIIVAGPEPGDPGFAMIVRGI